MTAGSQTAARSVGVRHIALDDGPAAITDVDGHDRVRVYLTWRDHLVGFVEVDNRRKAISATQLHDAVIETLGWQLLGAMAGTDVELAFAQALGAMTDALADSGEARDLDGARDFDGGGEGLDPAVPVSVVVATRDRPEDLHRCLDQLGGQRTRRQVEIVVVDNHPESGLTRPVVMEFPRVVLVEERRPGLSFARNSGILASTGAVIVCTDDDVRMPPVWLERLLAPFARSEVMAVTGNTLPLELATVAQRRFESYGGLGRGFEPREANGWWFRRLRSAVPTWHLGGTANAAFRATIFHQPEIGLLEESLGAGMPAGVGEDTYLFYRILKAGHTVVYAPDAYVWHRHRHTMPALRRQLFDYSAGHVAYHLTTLVQDWDLRALHYLAVQLPSGHLRRLRNRLRRRSDYPVSLQLVEAAGNVVGPVAFVRSRRRAARMGRPVGARGERA